MFLFTNPYSYSLPCRPSADFAASLERVRAAICRCSFLALDCEFSGLSTGGSTCQYDSPEERYAHLRRTTSGFLVIQFGLAAFTLEKEHNRWADAERWGMVPEAVWPNSENLVGRPA